jgi:phosphatidylglycerol:prolipoprotein diacylglycerol transferase
MFPRLLTVPAFELVGRTVGPLTLHTYGVLLALAFVAGLWIASRQGRKEGFDGARIADMAVYVLIAGLLGAKLLLLVVEWQNYTSNPRELFSLVQSGGVFYGGLLGAIPVALWYMRRHHLPIWKTADALAPAVILGQAIGRLGCFAAGCCYGRAANVPWAVTFRDPYTLRQVGTPLDVPLHPSQLYESFAAFVIFGILMWMASRKKFHGQVLMAYLGLYAIVRFVLEYFRGDTARGTVFAGALSTSQFIAILMVLAVLLLVPQLLKNHRVAPPAEPAPAA